MRDFSGYGVVELIKERGDGTAEQDCVISKR